jgi:hypothetical protein
VTAGRRDQLASALDDTATGMWMRQQHGPGWGHNVADALLPTVDAMIRQAQAGERSEPVGLSDQQQAAEVVSTWAEGDPLPHLLRADIAAALAAAREQGRAEEAAWWQAKIEALAAAPAAANQSANTSPEPAGAAGRQPSDQQQAADVARQCWWAGATGVPVDHAEQHAAAALAAARAEEAARWQAKIEALANRYERYPEIVAKQFAAALRALLDGDR